MEYLHQKDVDSHEDPHYNRDEDSLAWNPILSARVNFKLNGLKNKEEAGQQCKS